MAKCKLCKTNIPDGTEYCKDCQDKGNTNSNESYLDSLLNSVKNSVPPIESIYKKRKNTVIDNIEDSDKTTEPELDEFEAYRVDLSDIEDFEQFNLDDDLDDNENNIIINDEELFGEKLSNIFSDDKNKNQEHYDLEGKIAELVKGSEKQDQTNDELINVTDSYNSNQVNMDKKEKDNEYDVDSILSNHSQNNILPNEILEFHEADSFDPDLNDLLNSLDSSNIDIKEEAMAEQKMTEDDYLSLEDGIEPANLEDFEQMEDEEEDDFLSLLNQISSDDPVSADVKAINDLLNGGPVEPQRKSNTPSDVGDVFSDALKVVSSLNDPNELELLAKIPDKKKKSKKGKKDNKEEQEVVASKEKPKVSLFKRLFGNVEDEKATKKGKSLKSYNSQESAAAKVTTKKGKASKKKKGAATTENDDSLDDDKFGKERPGKETPVSKKDKKKDKKDKKKKTKEIIQVIDEIDEDEGRINRLGASIVFLFFGLLVLLLLVGTNVLSYSLSIQNATNYFDKQKYTQAYNEVYGIEIKDEDIEIYDKIMTVMFVNKQLNSYNSYYSMEKYPEALDSLLKGLNRYEKYIELATMLGIKTDLDYVRSQILAELNNVFNLSEEEALQMIDYDNMEEYSLKVYDVVLEQMNN